MDIRTTRLENGVVVATESLPIIRSASLGVYLDIGSRDEVAATNGLAHLFEHMVFKGTSRHDSLQIVKCFEATGGQINAYTSKEQTCFYAKVVDTDVSSGLSMLLEMVLDSTFDPAELEKEKDVVIEEIKGGNDNPEDYVNDLFSEAMFGKHSLGFPIAGTERTVKGLTRDDLVAHQKKAAGSLPIYVTAVGNVSHEAVVAVVRKAFRLRGKSAPSARSAAAPRRAPLRPGAPTHPRHLIDKRPVQQVTAILGGPSYAWDHPNRYALLLLNCIVGDGMSSKLFQKRARVPGAGLHHLFQSRIPHQRRSLFHRLRHRTQGRGQGHPGNQQAVEGAQENRTEAGRDGVRQKKPAGQHPPGPGVHEHPHGQPLAPAHVRGQRRNHRPNPPAP
jgi:predicted Zn-dependent peptidase